MRGYEIEETYVSLETAKLAKEKGFNVFCTHYYHLEYNIGELQTTERKFQYLNSDHDNLITAPTQSLLQKWLREKFFIHIAITSNSQESWQFHICIPNKYKLGDVYEEDFSSYEEALEVGLFRGLTFIK